MESSNLATIIGSGVTVVAVGIGVYVISTFMKNIKKDIMDTLNRQFTNCGTRMDKIDKVDDEQWTVLREHGHKGLDANGSKVVV
ncbi:hypothetical protein LCGC14_2987680 [marine sediment metagenome]|uniref:Uncharacterized protein n=1 Tax=marine sediment metagenome TaxID=412755 RepID=A0A0F8X4S0_9ZZZZ